MMAESKKKHATAAIECAEAALTHLEAARKSIILCARALRLPTRRAIIAVDMAVESRRKAQ